MATCVKVCGLTRVADALDCVDAGVDAIGLNFWPGSKRCISAERGREIVDAVGDRTLVVALFVNASLEEIEAMRGKTGFGCVQLHGDEPPEMLKPLLPHAYKAVRVKDAASIEAARSFPGDYILLDAYVPGVPGGTGATFDWSLARPLAKERLLTLAGGLTPDNVADAVRAARPYCVDTASGVESAPGLKDPILVRRFIEAARSLD